MQTPAPLRLLIVDDHALFREGVRLILERLPMPVVVSEASTAEQALQYAVPPGLILLDLNLPDLSGEECVRRFAGVFPGSLIVLMSGIDHPAALQAALAAGAAGFFHKCVTAAEMLKTIQSVLLGPAAGHSVDPGPEAGSLTSRQREVLACLCAGLTNKEIAAALALSNNTVRVHLYDIFRSLGVTSRTQAMIKAKLLGLG